MILLNAFLSGLQDKSFEEKTSKFFSALSNCFNTNVLRFDNDSKWYNNNDFI